MQPVVLVVLHNLTHLVRVDGRVVLVHLSDFFPLKNKERKSRSKRVNFSFILGDFYAFCLRGQFKAAFALQFLMPNSDLLIISDYIFFSDDQLTSSFKSDPYPISAFALGETTQGGRTDRLPGLGNKTSPIAIQN